MATGGAVSGSATDTAAGSAVASGVARNHACDCDVTSRPNGRFPCGTLEQAGMRPPVQHAMCFGQLQHALLCCPPQLLDGASCCEKHAKIM